MDELTAAVLEVLEDLGVVPSSDHHLGGADVRADLAVRIPTRDGDVDVVVDVKHRTDPLGAAELLGWADRHGTTAILALPYVSPHQGHRYRAAGVHYVDARGNAAIDLPGFHVRIEGRPAPPHAAKIVRKRPPSTAPAGLQVVFVLLQQPHLAAATYERLAQLATVSKGSVVSTMSDLRARGHLVDVEGSRRLVDTRRLTDDWLDGYSRDLLPRLEQRDLVGPPPDWWLDRPDPAGWTVGGGPALVAHGARLRPDRTVVYDTPPWTNPIRGGRLHPGAAPDVLLRRRFWSPELLPGATTVPPLLAYADALSGTDPREAQAARELWPAAPLAEG